jgi:hypothetical protein
MGINMQSFKKEEATSQTETVALHRGYWGYSEMTPEELKAVTGAGDGGGCGGGCGGCGGDAGDAAPAEGMCPSGIDTGMSCDVPCATDALNGQTCLTGIFSHGDSFGLSITSNGVAATATMSIDSNGNPTVGITDANGNIIGGASIGKFNFDFK